MRVIVIGAGVIGSSAAHRLAEGGADVLVLEAGRLAGGTSLVSYAWVNACEKLTSREYYQLNRAGIQSLQAVATKMDGAGWYPQPGVIQWRGAGAEAAGHDDVADDKFELLREWDYPAQKITPDELRRLEPEVDVSKAGGDTLIRYPEDGWLYAAPYCGAVMGEAARHGAKLRVGVRVSGLLIADGQVKGVTTSAGERIEADFVVNCAGRWSNDVLGDADGQIPLAPTLGIIAYTTATPSTLRHGLRSPEINLRPDGGGRLLLRSNQLDPEVKAADIPSPDHPLAQELRRRLVDLIPSLDGVAIEGVRIATRPIPQDGYSAVGAVPGLANYYVAVTHSGVTLSAFLGEAIEREVLRGEVVPELRDFRPARFFDAGHAG